MFIALGILLLLAWIVGFAVYHVAHFAIHLLLIFALISLIVHFVRGRFSPRASGP